MRRILFLLVVLAAAAGAAAYAYPRWSGAPADAGYRVGKVDRGDILATVNATGTINPTTTVIVGSQLSGQVVEILADYNSEVKADQVVARLNSDQIRARLDAARADLAQMRANKLVQEAQIERVKADTDRARATQSDMEAQIARAEALLADAERNFARQTELQSRGTAAQATLDTARANRDAQRAALQSARAQLVSAQAQIVGLAADLRVAEANVTAVTAQVAQREAAVRQIQVDLRNTDIRSPVSGTVVQRNVELGATVAASLQAPTLFLIADDLHRMEIAANIDETDVGRLRSGQRATFTVNAYPGRSFEGRVKQVRLGSQTVQNVVIYTTIISVDNPRLELMPGMTANLRVETDRRENVVRVPNAALRWRPPSVAADPPGQSPAGPAVAESPGPAGGRRGNADGGARNAGQLVDTLKSELTLSAAQIAEIEAAVADMRKSVAGGNGQDAAGRREQFRAARQELEQRIDSALTPEQRSRYAEIRQRATETSGGRATQTGRVFVVGPDGRPLGVTLRLGASDGGVTEVVAGLEADREVIVGGGPRTAEAPRGPRFGF